MTDKSISNTELEKFNRIYEILKDAVKKIDNENFSNTWASISYEAVCEPEDTRSNTNNSLTREQVQLLVNKYGYITKHAVTGNYGLTPSGEQFIELYELVRQLLPYYNPTS
jgi:hypothetical protein